jgi:hypothetical protein
MKTCTVFCSGCVGSLGICVRELARGKDPRQQRSVPHYQAQSSCKAEER